MPFPAILAGLSVAKKAFPVVKALAGKIGGAAASPAGTVALGAGAAYAGTKLAQPSAADLAAGAPLNLKGGGARGGFGGRRRRRGMSAARWGNVMLASKMLGKSSPGMAMIGMKIASRIA